MLPNTLQSRGVDDKSRLPCYPYRDDSLLYWEAIHQWVSSYLGLYYPSDAEVQQDTELAGWYTELVATDGGRVQGLGKDGGLHSRDYLNDVVTLLIFTCSVQHAAVNFPQYELMSYTPNMPLAAVTPAPTSKTGATLQDYLAMLPSLRQASKQLNLGYLLGSVHYTTLGQYDPLHFHDERVIAPLQAFQKELLRIGQVIEERNRERRPYSFLVPAGIPQSINI